MEVAFTLYNRFLIAEYSGTDVRAYRSREFYAGNTTSYEASSQAFIEQVIADSEDQGDFSEAEYYRLMRDLGRAGPSYGGESVTPKYPNSIMEKVRQRLGLGPDDASRDEDINGMSQDEVFQHCLYWEGIVGYENQIKGWIKDIYGVELGDMYRYR